jgi:integrase/recombinase XerD
MNECLLQSRMQEYIALRQALDAPLGERERQLRDFVKYLRQRPDVFPIRAQAAIDWACMNQSHSAATRSYRLSLARGFLRHLKASMPDVEIPDSRLIAASRRPHPYIFSTKDLNRLMRKAGKDPKRNCSIHPLTLQTIVGLMACSGLRPGEIIRLRVSDLFNDQEVPRLLIRASKFKKSRWVPLHYTAFNRLVDYVEWREQRCGASQPDALFVYNNGRPLGYQRLRARFVEVIQQLRLSPKAGQRGPTLHSLRHTFAVHRVRQWYAWKMDTRRLLPILSIYLGHKSLEGSYWYLSATPELMSAASQLFESYAKVGGVA